MNHEEKIVAAIDRCTAAVDRQTALLPEQEPLLDLAKNIRDWVRAIFILICLTMFVLIIAISSAHAAPLVSDGDEIASVGTVQEARRKGLTQ